MIRIDHILTTQCFYRTFPNLTLFPSHILSLSRIYPKIEEDNIVVQDNPDRRLYINNISTSRQLLLIDVVFIIEKKMQINILYSNILNDDDNVLNRILVRNE